MPVPQAQRFTVIMAAAEIADAQGLSQLTFARVAHRLEVRATTINRHFASLDDLRRDLAFLGLRLLANRLGAAIMGKARGDAIMAAANAYRGFAVEHPGLILATFLPVPPGDDALQQCREHITQILIAIMNGVDLVGDDALHAARAFRSMAHGFASIEISGGFGRAMSTDESFQRLIQTYINGLERRGSTRLFGEWSKTPSSDPPAWLTARRRR